MVWEERGAMRPWGLTEHCCKILKKEKRNLFLSDDSISLIEKRKNNKIKQRDSGYKKLYHFIKEPTVIKRLLRGALEWLLQMGFLPPRKSFNGKERHSPKSPGLADVRPFPTPLTWREKIT